MKKKMTGKKRVLKGLPEAYCVRLSPRGEHTIMGHRMRFIVWPGPVQPPGFERPAIGLGRTAAEAWASVNQFD